MNIKRPLRSLALVVGFSALAYFGVLTRLDWWLYQFRQHDTVRDSASVITRLQQTGLPLQTLGSVQYENHSWPLTAVLVKHEHARRQACIVGGIHGNEPAGTEAALSLATDLGQHHDLYPDTSFVILPLANPWGYAHNLRHNGNNRDIARNFTEGGTQETALIKKLLERAHCDILIDLHEDRLDHGFYLLGYDSASAAALTAMAQAITRTTGIEPSRRAEHGLLLIARDDFSSQSRTTLSLYARQHGTAASYIIETPERLRQEERVQLHRLWVDGLLQL